jgi:formiminoglutamase
MNSAISSPNFQWSWISIPDHQGVVHVGGRLGAAQGPASAWAVFNRMKGRTPVKEQLREHAQVSPITSDIQQNHRAAAKEVQNQADAAPFTVVIGGGHDLAFPHLLGLKNSLRQRLGREPHLGCINLDAHLDVRKPTPHITSGSPFYLALEEGVLEAAHFVEFGIQSHCNGSELWSYIESKKVKVIPFQEVRKSEAALQSFRTQLALLAQSCDAIVVSLDLDCLAQAAAPGVSAPQAEGFAPNDLIQMLEDAAREPKVCSLGVFELNPVYDQDEKTARIAATAVWHMVEQKLATQHGVF